MTEEDLDWQEIGDNTVKFDLGGQLILSSSELAVVKTNRTGKEWHSCYDSSLSCHRSCLENSSSEVSHLSYLWSICRRAMLSKPDSLDSKLFIIAELLLFAVVEVIQNRESSSKQCQSSFSPRENVEKMAIFHTYLEEHEQNHMNRDGSCNYCSFTCNTRKQVILWLVDIGQLFELSSETIALTVEFMDKLMGKSTISRDFLHGIVGGCLFTFSKWLDFRPLSLGEIASIVNVSGNSLKIFEEIILFSLDWHLQLKTVHDVFSKISLKFRQLYWDIYMDETSWEEVVSTVELYLNVSLLCEELSTYDHSMTVLLVLGLVYRKMFRENYMHEENRVDGGEDVITELFAEIAKEYEVSQDNLVRMEHELQSLANSYMRDRDRMLHNLK